LLPPPPSSTLFPYTTLFRSHEREDADGFRLLLGLAEHGDDDPEDHAGRERPTRALEETGRHEGHLRLREAAEQRCKGEHRHAGQDRKSTRLNSSHSQISYAV